MLKAYIHPGCTTVKRALKFLDAHNVEYETSDLTEEPISKKDIKKYHELSGLDIKRFFNTSGMLYRKLELSKKLDGMTLNEKYEILSSDGMLVKRPLITDGKKVTVGFKEEEFLDAWV